MPRDLVLRDRKHLLGRRNQRAPTRKTARKRDIPSETIPGSYGDGRHDDRRGFTVKS